MVVARGNEWGAWFELQQWTEFLGAYFRGIRL